MAEEDLAGQQHPIILTSKCFCHFLHHSNRSIPFTSNDYKYTIVPRSHLAGRKLLWRRIFKSPCLCRGFIWNQGNWGHPRLSFNYVVSRRGLRTNVGYCNQGKYEQLHPGILRFRSINCDSIRHLHLVASRH